MINLRSIKCSISLGYHSDFPIPSFDHPKLRSLLSLQRGPNGLRDLQIKVLLQSIEGTEPLPTFRPRYPTRYPRFGEFDTALQERLRKGAEPRLSDGQSVERMEVE